MNISSILKFDDLDVIYKTLLPRHLRFLWILDLFIRSLVIVMILLVLFTLAAVYATVMFFAFS